MTTENNLFLRLKGFLSGKAGIILAYLLLALFFTFPLILNFRDSIPGGTDDPLWFSWYLWFFKHTLIDLGINPFTQNSLLFYPAGFNISSGYDSLLTVFISLPFQLITKNLFAVYNILVIFNFVFSSCTAYLLVKYLTNDKKISFIAGIIFGFSPYMLARSLMHLNLLSTGMIPLFVLFFLRSLKEPSGKNSFYLALSFLFVSLSSWQYGLFASLFMFFSLFFFFFASKNTVLNKKYLANFVLFAALSALLVLPFALPMISNKINDKMYLPGQDEYIVYSADALSYMTPAPSNTFLGKFTNKEYFNSLSGNAVESTVYLGILEIIFIVCFLLKLKKNELKEAIQKNAYWLTLAFIFFILSLGPILKIGGYMTGITLPYYFIYTYLPFFTFAKEPARIGVFVILFTAIIFSVFLKTYLDQKRSKTSIILIFFVITIIAERIELPYQIKKIGIPVFYNTIAEDKNDYAILDLPSNIRRHQQSSYNFYQTIHQKKIISGTMGYTSFASDSYLWIEKNNFILEGGCYTEEEKKDLNISDAKTDYNKGSLLKNFTDAKIKYVIVHKNIISGLEEQGVSCQKLKDNINDLFQNTHSIFKDEMITIYQIY